MGKTLGAILTVAAAVAVNVIPGVGQVVSGALAGTIGVTGATAVLGGITLAGISTLPGLVGLGPKAPKPDTAEMAMSIASSDLVTSGWPGKRERAPYGEARSGIARGPRRVLSECSLPTSAPLVQGCALSLALADPLIHSADRFVHGAS
jgi:hypothetical protein